MWYGGSHNEVALVVQLVLLVTVLCAVRFVIRWCGIVSAGL